MHLLQVQKSKRLQCSPFLSMPAQQQSLLQHPRHCTKQRKGNTQAAAAAAVRSQALVNLCGHSSDASFTSQEAAHFCCCPVCLLQRLEWALAAHP
jgi:hypothetical protein